MQYSMGLELYENDEKKQLNILKYNTLSDVIGKKLKVLIDLKKAVDIPEKLCHEVQCKYQWLDSDRTEFTTKIVDDKVRNPVFGYKTEHMIEIDEDLISYMVENTLTIGVYGKTEQRKKLGNSPNGKGDNSNFLNLHAIPEEEEEKSPMKSGKKSLDNSRLKSNDVSIIMKDGKD